MLLAPLVVEPMHRLDGPLAAVLVISLHVGVPLFIAILALGRAARARAQAARAKRDAVANTPLAPGPSIVHGPVELEQGSTVAVRVEIDQTGEERESKKLWSHTWTESARRTTFRPFYVKDIRGARVRVEPDDRTHLVDKLDKQIRKGATRTRIAELAEGERVFVVGELAGHASPGSYREAPSELVLRAPRGGRLLCAAESLEGRFMTTYDQNRSAAKAFLVLAALIALLDFGFYMRLALGRPEVATVTKSWTKGGKQPSCKVELEGERGDAFSDEVRTSWCKSLLPGTTLQAFNPRMGGWFAHVGTSAGLHVSAFIGCLFLVVVGSVMYVRRSRPWYDAPVVDHGAGRLSASK